MDQSVFIPIYTLKTRFHVAGLLNNPQYEKEKENTCKFQRLMMLMTYACEYYYNLILWSNRLENPDLDFNDSSIGILR